MADLDIVMCAKQWWDELQWMKEDQGENRNERKEAPGRDGCNPTSREDVQIVCAMKNTDEGCKYEKMPFGYIHQDKDETCGG